MPPTPKPPINNLKNDDNGKKTAVIIPGQIIKKTIRIKPIKARSKQ